MDIITSLLDRFKSPNTKDDESISTENFGSEAILAICILMIEVSRSDDKFDEVEHINKNLVSKSDLTAGTGYGINYTNRIKSAAMSLTKDILWTTN